MSFINLFFLFCCVAFSVLSFSILRNTEKRREKKLNAEKKNKVSEKTKKVSSEKKNGKKSEKPKEKKKTEKEEKKKSHVSDTVEKMKAIDVTVIAKNSFSFLETVFILFFLILGLADLTKLADFGEVQGAFTLIGFAVFAEVTIVMINIGRNSSSGTLKFFGRILLGAVLLEATVFQMPSYHTFLGNNEEIVLSPSAAQIGGSCEITDEGFVVSGKEEALITFENLNEAVDSLYADIDFGTNTKRTELVLDITDESHYTFRYDIARSRVIYGRENTAYLACQFSGKVGTIRVKFTNPEEHSRIEIKNIIINKPIPFVISWIRVLLIVLLSTFVYAVIHSGVMLKPYSRSRRFCNVSVGIMTAAVVVLAFSIVYRELPDMNLKKQFELTSGNQITQEIVDAFENGQISLLEEPPQELVDLENPYDWGMRNDNGVSALWDHVMYNGKYYTYYGIAPVILLYLPYHMITGYYFSTNISILLFSIIGLIGLALTYMAIIKRWFRNIPSGIVLSGMVILFSSCGIWYSVGRNIFYEISISAGFAFVALGSYFLISSNVLGNFRTSLVRIFLSSLFFGLAVLSRPTLAVYAICACIYFFYGTAKSGRTSYYAISSSSNRSRQITYWVCAMLPLVCLGIFQMWYNYVRFDSPFDFGIKYSLTINDFTHSQYHTHFVLITIWQYLFSVPSITTDYPFITTPFTRLDVNGYYFSDAGNTSGIIFLAFPVFGYIYSKKVLSKLPTLKERLRSILLVGLPCIIMPLVIMFSIWESGYAVRYTADFSWQIIMGAFAVLFYLYQKSKSADKKKLFTQFMALSSVASFIINGVQIFNFTFPKDEYPALCDHLSQLFAFWK